MASSISRVKSRRRQTKAGDLPFINQFTFPVCFSWPFFLLVVVTVVVVVVAVVGDRRKKRRRCRKKKGEETTTATTTKKKQKRRTQRDLRPQKQSNAATIVSGRPRFVPFFSFPFFFASTEPLPPLMRQFRCERNTDDDDDDDDGTEKSERRGWGKSQKKQEKNTGNDKNVRGRRLRRHRRAVLWLAHWNAATSESTYDSLFVVDVGRERERERERERRCRICGCEATVLAEVPL